MMDDKAFERLISQIQAQGYDLETAAHYAAMIGDTPIFNEEGNIVVREGRETIAILKPLEIFKP